MREAVSICRESRTSVLSDTTRLYLRDVYDHLVQIIDLIETYRELASDLTDIYISSVSNRMNEIMKVLTVIGTIFIPLTFLAGVYGMNFHFFRELSLSWAYPPFGEYAWRWRSHALHVSPPRMAIARAPLRFQRCSYAS